MHVQALVKTLEKLYSLLSKACKELVRLYEELGRPENKKNAALIRVEKRFYEQNNVN